MVTFTINIPPMLAYILYMEHLGYELVFLSDISDISHEIPGGVDQHLLRRGLFRQRPERHWWRPTRRGHQPGACGGVPDL